MLSALEQIREKESIVEDFTKIQTGSCDINDIEPKINPLIIELKHERIWKDIIGNEQRESLSYPTFDLGNIIDASNSFKDSDEDKVSNVSRHIKKLWFNSSIK